MSIYKEFCSETLDENGALKSLTLDYPEDFNFGYDVVDRLAERFPDKRALVWCNLENEEHIFTFSDIKRESNRIANALSRCGIRRGDRVLMILKRHYEYWFTAIALHKLGAVMIPATHMLTTDDLVYRLKASGAKAAVVTTQNELPKRLLEASRLAGVRLRLFSVQEDADGF